LAQVWCVWLAAAWSQMPPSTGGMLSHESTAHTHTQLQGKKSITTSLSSSSPLFAATPSTRTRFGGRNKKYFPPLYYCYLHNSSGSLSFAAFNIYYVKIDFTLVTYLQGLNWNLSVILLLELSETIWASVYLNDRVPWVHAIGKLIIGFILKIRVNCNKWAISFFDSIIFHRKSKLVNNEFPSDKRPAVLLQMGVSPQGLMQP